ncbi:MAG: hypothetical protein RIT81_13705 [Deltaproteobacteria bacterium]
MARWFVPLLFLVACSSPVAELRKATYGPQFTYVEGRDLKANMWSIANDVNRLDTLLRDPQGTDADAIAEVLRHLEATTHALEGGTTTNHPRLDANLAHFVQEVTAARVAAEADPPNYFLAGSITGSCLHCHR